MKGFLPHPWLSGCVSLISQDTSLKAAMCVYKYIEGGVSMTILSQQNRGRHRGSLWSPARIFSWKDWEDGEWGTLRDRSRGDTSPRHQWAFILSFRYPSLLCFWASSIKYETLRQKEGKWKGRGAGATKATTQCLWRGTETKSVVSANVCTLHTHTHTKPFKWCGRIGWQTHTFASCVFRSFVRIISQKGRLQWN